MTEDDRKSANGSANGRGKEPIAITAKDALRAPLPKRFYKSVSIEARDGGFAILLDGRPIRTPGKQLLVLSVEALAEAVAAEWEAQGERIDPTTMPLTRLVNTALDAVTDKMDEVADDIAAFAASDLLCYRAEAPEGLVLRQAEAWDPPLAWARIALGADLTVQTGLMPVDQPAEAIASVRAVLGRLDALSLAATHVLTTLTGSAILALAHVEGQMTLEEAWTAATVDERWQSELWGRDAEAEARSAERLAEATAAARCLRLLQSR
ncbi:ATP12 family protein [Hyphomicrobium sp.]|uniref:ATP12 family chaperone protein n=1 Tax=Hyphomicrobium sp. TaxID=82 RepID=UPI002C0E29DE|nr:ATP12 family protein [Hyphomicrobium sp.]HRN87197.1 ATP12 family protein [Hyphomicrobium sp.]HRQ25819.1 ATP12 family protein [Hyphomicrobium sp.]